MNDVPTQPTISFSILAELRAAGSNVNLVLEQTQEKGITVLRGGMLKGQRLPVVALLQEIIPELTPLESFRQLAITRLQVELRPKYSTFTFDAAIANLWVLELESGPTLAIDEVTLLIKTAPQEKTLAFTGKFRLFGGDFALSVKQVVSTLNALPSGGQSSEQPATQRKSQWIISARANNIHLEQLVKAIFNEDPGQFGLEKLVISVLEFNLIRTQSTNPVATESIYAFRGAVLWDTGISLTDGGASLQVEAIVDVRKKPGQAIAGQIKGSVSASVPFFETLRLSAIYTFGPVQKDLIFQLQLGRLLLTAIYKSTASSKILSFTVGLADGRQAIKFGEIISAVVSLYDPNITDFELDAPWDELGKQEIQLNKFKFEINLTTKSFTVAYNATLDLVLFKVSDIGLTYQRTSVTQSSISLSLTINIPGQGAQSTAWDPVNENPPTVPSQGTPPIFDLQFLAIGQRVSFAPEIVAQARNITQVMNVMRQTMIPLPPAQRRQNPLVALQNALPPAPVSVDPTQAIQFSGEPIQFNAASGLLLGAQFSVIGTLDMSLIFNDPLIYGLRIGLSGAKAKIFAGLQFEILYRRISDTVGVYHTELTLPDAMRQLEFGAVSVTLPVVVIDIYTNGDFGLDVGFPWNGDFSRSFAVQAFPFIGAGGFYFYKLSAETATSVPVITNGKFNPVLEFGIGLMIGLGKSFDKGVLKAELSISVHGLLQGVIAWFNPSDPALPTDQYYRVQGGIAIVGRLYGVVDFEVIRVDVEVIVRAAVLFVVESYQPTQLVLEAQVSVRASIKIVFVRIHFSFSLKVRQEFTLGSAKPTPWRLAPNQPARAAQLQARTAVPMSNFAAFAAPQAIASPPSVQRSAAVPDTVEVAEMPPASTVSDTAIAHESAVTPVAFTQNQSVSGTTEFSASVTSLVESLVGGRSLNWQPVKFAIPSDIRPETKEADKLRLDIYFQPAVTKTENGVRGLALLFIENSIDVAQDNPQEIGNSAIDNDTDFDELVKLLLKWTVYAYMSTDSANSDSISIDNILLTLDLLEDIYSAVVQDFQDSSNVFNFWNTLTQFLGKNILFDINDRPKKSGEISGAIFPMFPQLTMQLGDNGPIRDFDGDAVFRRTAQVIQDLRDYFQPLQVRHGNTVEQTATPVSDDGNSSTGNPVSGPDMYMAQLIFVDYFKLLIRSVLQSAIDHVEDQIKQSGSTREYYRMSVIELLNTLNQGGPFNHLAATASRFLLHGLRLPKPTGQETEALYQATGQQFDIAVSSNPTSGVVTIAPHTITLRDPDNLPWIRFIDYTSETTSTRSDNTLRYVFPSEIDTLIQQLNTASLNLSNQLPDALPFYVSSQQHYTLRQKTLWQQNGETTIELLELPSDLRAYLGTKSNGVDLSLKLNQTNQAGNQLQPEAIASSQITWLTKIRVNIRRVSNSDGSKTLRNTYLMLGTDEPGKDLLEAILNTNAALQVSILYGSGNSSQSDNATLISRSNANSLLLKTNLKTSITASDTPDLYSAQLSANASEDERKNFIKLLWQSSTITSGGHYFYYAYEENDELKDLPDEVFKDGLSATLVLLIQLDKHTQKAYSFHNCVAIADSIPSDADVLVESADTVKALSIPAGNLGFRLTRDAILIDSNNNTAEDELQNFYQLLGYQLNDSSKDADSQSEFRNSDEGLPIGPAADDPNTPLDDGLWIYERVLPVYAFAGQLRMSDRGSQLPPASLNPYAGISETAAVGVQFDWRDVYGNRYANTSNLTKLFKVRYFDKLIGLNQWPSVGESYTFTRKDDQTVNLNLELVLDQSKYIPVPGSIFEEIQQKTSADRATYQQIYYQIHQPDITFTVHTSVLNGDSYTFTGEDRAFFTDFIDSAYQYLSQLEALSLYTHSIANENTLQSISSSYYVTMRDLAEANQKLRNLFAPGTSLVIPIERDLTLADTLSAIARDLVIAESILAGNSTLSAIAIALETLPDVDNDDLTAKIKQLVTAHKDTPNLLVEGTRVQVSDATDYQVVLGDTFETIASKTNQTLEQVAILIQDQDGLLDDKVFLSVPLSYRTQNNDSLEFILRKVQFVTNDDQIALLANKLTVVDIVNQPQPLSLNLNPLPPLGDEDASTPAPLNIPNRLRLMGTTGSSSSVRSLQKVTDDFNTGLPAGQHITVADVAIANQTVMDLIASHISLLSAFSNLTSLSQTGILSYIPATAFVTREHETIYTVKSLLEGLLERLKLAIASEFNPIEQDLQQVLEDLEQLKIASDYRPDDLSERLQAAKTLLQKTIAQHQQLYPVLKQQMESVIDRIQTIEDSSESLPTIDLLTTLREALSLATKAYEALNQMLERTPTLADIAGAIAMIPDLIVPNQALIKPPFATRKTLEFDLRDEHDQLRYPASLIFPVTVQIDINRDPNLIHETVQDIPEVASVTAYLSPKALPVAAIADAQTASLREFARQFQEAFQALRLATSDDRGHSGGTPGNPDGQTTKPVWAVHLADTGVSYNINESMPFFFTPAPLVNSLMSGAVKLYNYTSEGQLETDSSTLETKRFEAVDLNVLAREFLKAVEDVLKPDVTIPAMQLSSNAANKIRSILKHKAKLAKAISDRVKHILAQTDNTDISDRRQRAADALRQELLVNLADAYDIETIVQYNVDVAIADHHPWRDQIPQPSAPRLSGQPIILGAKDATSGTDLDLQFLDFVLSPAKVPLESGSSYLTFFFNTQTPARYEDIVLNLTYRVNELEYDISPVPAMEGYQSSSWLSFILPIDSTESSTNPAQNPNYIGDIQIPIPLRTYPIPPSLVLHKAEPDPDSLERLTDIRQWQYVYTYEHPDVAQDSIESKVYYNVSSEFLTRQPLVTTLEDADSKTLFDVLINFTNLYPKLLPELQALAKGEIQNNTSIENAISAFESLVNEVADQWGTWNTLTRQVSLEQPHYEINEEIPASGNGQVKEITITRYSSGSTHAKPAFPNVILPGYRQEPDPTSSDDEILYTFTRKSADEAALEPVYGESSIPDRTLIIQDLDIIEHQNAWSSIWLTRNKQLIAGMTTNPEFVFQTPQVHFKQWITPLIFNHRYWDIAKLNSVNDAPQERSLQDHLDTLLATLLPTQASQAYDIRIACRYAFAVAIGSYDDDLLSALPVVLSPRFRIEKGVNTQEATRQLSTNLATEIQTWQTQNNPIRTKGMYIFTVSLFSGIETTDASNTTNLPLLEIDYLKLALQHIAD